MWKFLNLSLHKRRIFPTLTGFLVFPFLPLLQLLECLSQWMCGDNLTINNNTGRRNICLKKVFLKTMIRFYLSFFVKLAFVLSVRQNQNHVYTNRKNRNWTCQISNNTKYIVNENNYIAECHVACNYDYYKLVKIE